MTTPEYQKYYEKAEKWVKEHGHRWRDGVFSVKTLVAEVFATQDGKSLWDRDCWDEAKDK